MMSNLLETHKETVKRMIIEELISDDNWRAGFKEALKTRD